MASGRVLAKRQAAPLSPAKDYSDQLSAVLSFEVGNTCPLQLESVHNK